MGSVTIRDVRKAYGGLTVLHGVSVDIADGEFVVLVGPSGCGKSTLLRMVAGLEEITGGDMLIDDAVINDMPPKNRDIAMVFQSYALYPHMTVAENMGFALRLNGTPKAEIQRRVEDAARILSLEPYLDRLPRNLSGGQRQRVAMGRAIVRKPKVFLFDEPLSNLDAKLRVQMRSEIKQNHARLRTTTIYVTHDQVEAMTMADRIVVMNGGRIEQVGTPLELYDRPRNLFVAGFIGSPSMNFITGTLADNQLTAADGTTIALADLSTGNTLSGPVTIGVRPEHFVVDPAGTEAIVLTVEPTGSETQVLLRLAGQEITVSFRDRVDAAPGSVLKLSPSAGYVHVFDSRSGERLPS